jgi:DNA-binding CsgD family transcriptional regulator
MKTRLKELIKEYEALKVKYDAMERENENYRHNAASVNTLVFDTYFVTPTEIYVKHPGFFANLLGYDDEELEVFGFEKFFSRIHPEDKADYKRMMNMFINKEKKEISGFFRMLHKSGIYIWLYGMVRLKGYDSMTDKPVISGVVHRIMSDSLLDEKLKQLMKEILLLRSDKNKHNLTAHELEIARYFADGLHRKEIALKLNISVSTIKGIKKSILKKTNTGSTPELVKFLINNGLY